MPSRQPTRQPTSLPTAARLPQVFTYTGAYATYVVPLRCSSLYVRLFGGKGFEYDGHSGGLGGYVAAIISVTPGTTLQVWVGGAAVIETPGFNGGGNGAPYYGRGGGGASDIRTNSSFSSRIIVAGGGGGAAYGGAGGAGGGLVGGTGGHHGGKGGSQIRGGVVSHRTVQSSANYNGSFGIGANSGNCGT